MLVKEAVATRFMDICKNRNVTINRLANDSGVTPSTAYSMMDAKRKDLSIRTIKKLCDGLDISLKDFFDDPIFDGLEQEIR